MKTREVRKGWDHLEGRKRRNPCMDVAEEEVVRVEGGEMVCWMRRRGRRESWTRGRRGVEGIPIWRGRLNGKKGVG